MPSTILDAFGRPAQSTGGGIGTLYSRTQSDSRMRPPQSWHFDDYISLLSSGRWRDLVSESRAIGSRGLVAAAIAQKADYISASDWRPYFSGEDATWGEEAEQLLEDTTALVCTRGPRYDWRTFWRIGVISSALDGGFFINLTEGTGGWPLLQPLEAHRIGNRSGGSAIVTNASAFTTIKKDDGTTDQIETPYTGLRIVNGIIYNSAGAEVAYRVLGPTPKDDEDISARDMIHVGAPRWFSEGRPVPQIAPALMDLLGVDMARQAQLDQQIIHSKITLKETNETGRRDPVKDLVNPPMANPTLNNTAPEVIERGQIRYIKNGGSLEAHKSEVPSDQWMNFDLRTAGTAIAAIGWRLEMLDPSDMNGATSRAFADQINTQIAGTFKDFYHACLRCNRYRISKHIIREDLPPSKEFLKWGITPPPDYVVDRNSTRIDIEAVGAGADAMPNLHRRAGQRPRQVLTAQAKYVAMKDEIAKKYKVDPDDLGVLSFKGQANDNADKATNTPGGAAKPNAKPTSSKQGTSTTEQAAPMDHLEAEKTAQEILREKIETYGTGVRAGVITPNIEDERALRIQMGLPAPSKEVSAAWKEDGGARKPITLQGQKENAAQATAVASSNEP